MKLSERLEEWFNTEEGCDPTMDEIIGDVQLVEQQRAILQKATNDALNFAKQIVGAEGHNKVVIDLLIGALQSAQCVSESCGVCHGNGFHQFECSKPYMDQIDELEAENRLLREMIELLHKDATKNIHTELVLKHRSWEDYRDYAMKHGNDLLGSCAACVSDTCDHRCMTCGLRDCNLPTGCGPYPEPD